MTWLPWWCQTCNNSKRKWQLGFNSLLPPQLKITMFGTSSKVVPFSNLGVVLVITTMLLVEKRVTFFKIFFLHGGVRWVWRSSRLNFKMMVKHLPLLFPSQTFERMSFCYSATRSRRPHRGVVFLTVDIEAMTTRCMGVSSPLAFTCNQIAFL